MSGATQAANNFLAAAGITGPTQSKAITQLVADLYSSGLWPKMKAVYPMVTDNRNLLSYSEAFDNAYWQKGSTTITTNTTTAPNGTNTADKVSETSATGYHFTTISDGAMINTNNYTLSFYAKAAERTWCSVYLYDGTNLYQTFFDLANGAVGSIGSGMTASIESVGNGWYRCRVSRNIVGALGANGGILTATGNNQSSFAGTTGSGIYIWGAQLEVGSTVSTYQPILTTPSAFMASQMKYNLKDARDLDAAFRLTWSGGWTYSATGATPNGTNAYADTKFIPSYNSSNGLNYGTYTRTTSNAAGYNILIGSGGAGSFMYIGGGGESYLGSGSSVIMYPNLTNGYYIRNGNSSGQIAIKNNTLIGTNTSAATYVTTSILLGAGNAVPPSPGSYSNAQIAFSHFSESLTQQEGFILNQIVEKYQVALSRGVQAAQSFYYNSAYSNEANTYLYSTQITGTTQVSAINTLINGLKANNLWSKMKAVYPFVTDIKNMLAYTEDFTNAFWGKQNITVTANSITAPDGTTTADTVTSTSSSGYVILSQALPPLTNGQIYTISRYVKAGTANFCTLGLHALADAYFDLANLTYSFSGTGAVSASIIDVGNGWRRISATYTWSGSTYNAYFAMASSLSNIFGNTIGNYQYTWGGQLEVGSIATAYQPVLGANNYSTNVAAQMKFNLVNPQDSDAAFRLAFSGGWTYSTNGAQPNGTNGYADTKLVPSANLGANDTHLSYYSRTNIVSSGVEMGAYNLGFNNSLYLLYNYSGTAYKSFNSAESSRGSTYNPTTGLLIGSRINSQYEKYYHKGNLIDTLNITSQPTNSINIYIGAYSSNNIPGQYSSKQIAFATIGTGLSDAEAALLYQLVQDYQTTLSRQV